MIEQQSPLDALRERGFYQSPSNFCSFLSNEQSEPVLSFFRLPKEEKEATFSKDRARRGYSPSSTENFATLIGEKRANDFVEKFRVGPEVDEGVQIANADYFASKSSRVHFFPNDWSAVPNDFKEVAIRIYNTSEGIMRDVISFFIADISDSFNLHTSILSINFYSPTQILSESNRIAEHKDVSFITIVANLTPDDENNSRLQVFDAVEYVWKDLTIPSGGFVILVGEYLEYVSGGEYRAALHRVSPVFENVGNRASFAFFVSPNYDATLDLRAPNDDHSPLLAYDKWRKWKVSQAMKVASSK